MFKSLDDLLKAAFKNANAEEIKQLSMLRAYDKHAQHTILLEQIHKRVTRLNYAYLVCRYTAAPEEHLDSFMALADEVAANFFLDGNKYALSLIVRLLRPNFVKRVQLESFAAESEHKVISILSNLDKQAKDTLQRYFKEKGMI